MRKGGVSITATNETAQIITGRIITRAMTGRKIANIMAITDATTISDALTAIMVIIITDTTIILWHTIAITKVTDLLS